MHVSDTRGSMTADRLGRTPFVQLCEQLPRWWRFFLNAFDLSSNLTEQLNLPHVFVVGVWRGLVSL